MTERRYVPGAIAEQKQAREDHARNTPVAMLDLLRDEEAAILMFEGLKMHYLECIGSKRLDVWAKAGHAMIDLLASPNSTVHSRAVMSYGNALAQLEIKRRDAQINPRITEARKNGANV